MRITQGKRRDAFAQTRRAVSGSIWVTGSTCLAGTWLLGAALPACLTAIHRNGLHSHARLKALWKICRTRKKVVFAFLSLFSPGETAMDSEPRVLASLPWQPLQKSPPSEFELATSSALSVSPAHTASRGEGAEGHPWIGPYWDSELVLTCPVTLRTRTQSSERVSNWPKAV